MRILKKPVRQIFLTSAVLFVMIALNIAAQTFFFRHTFSEGAVTSFMPAATDGVDYMRRAAALADSDGFEDAFRDGLRMPGYPVFLSFFAKFFTAPESAARIAQILLSSSLILIFWIILSSLTRSALAALTGAFLCAAWLPFYYYSPVLYAESVSMVLFALLLLTLSRFDPLHSIRSLAVPAVLTAVLIYMKPNQIMLLLPVLAYAAGVTAGKGIRPAANLFLVPFVIVIVLLTPWTVFVSRCQQSPVMLTTHGGWNLFLGTGGGHSYSSERHQGSLSTRAWNSLDLHDKEDSTAEYAAIPSNMRAAADREYRNKALERWKRQPLKLTAYGFCKVLHIFGFSARGPRDFLVMLHFLVSTAFSILLWKRRQWREWSLLLWSITFITAAQAFLFLGELRFKTVLFDPPALIVIVLGLFVLLQQIFPSRFHAVSGR